MRITQEEALELFNSDDLIGIGMAANGVRRKKTDPRVATYQIDRNINYTNFCTEYCSFCAFYRPLGAKDGYILSLETIYEKIREMIEIGGTGVLMQGGLHPDLRVEFYENMLSSIKQKFPQVHLHCFSAPEILCIAEVSGLSVRDTIARCRTRLDSGRRRGNSRRRNSCAHFAAEVPLRRMGRHASDCAFTRDAHHGDDDVRLRRGLSPPRESHGTPAPDSGRYRRVHGVYSLDFCAGEYPAREENS